MRKSPKDIFESARGISRRGVMLGVIQAAVMTTLGLRMRSMQLDRAEEYRLLSDGNAIRIKLLRPTRGLIMDRNGLLLAGNEQDYRATITAAEAGEDLDAVFDRLRHLIPLSDEEIADLKTTIARRGKTTPVSIRDHLSWQEFSSIGVNGPALPGVRPERIMSRIYPRADDFAHALGYVGRVSDYDLSKMEDPDPVLKLPEIQFGKVGLENKLEDVLRGKAGTRRVEVNNAEREMRELSRHEGSQGAEIQVTLDSRLQNYCRQRLGEEAAAAVVMDVNTGDVLAIASSPTFDPNLFVRGISVSDYKALTEHDHRPLADKTVQGLYPPGSTFKMVTLLAGLDAGVINGGSSFYCNGHLELASRKFHCWSRGGHGKVGVIRSLQQSCDVFYYELALKVGIERISAMAKRLGLGVRHDLPMSAVAKGIAPTKAWKKERYDKDWLLGDSLNASIGQGYVLASPLQLAVMTSRIASGKAVEPRLVRATDGIPAPVPDFPDLGIDQAWLKLARRGMDAVVNTKSGTAKKSRIARDEWRMAGKTGTSQVRNISAAERRRGVIRNDQLPWKRRDHALFVCYAPVDAPKYAVSVVIEHGGGGSVAAAPVARDIMLAALEGGTPPLNAYPSDQRANAKARHDAMEPPLPAPPTSSGKSRA